MDFDVGGYLNSVCYFVCNVRSNMCWCSNVRSILPTCLNIIVLNSGNFKKNKKQNFSNVYLFTGLEMLDNA
jgi:hypothetical protein